MQLLSRSALLQAVVLALATGIHSSTPNTQAASICTDLTIPVTVHTPRFIINVTIQDNWDAEDFTLNDTSRDSASTFNPISGQVNKTSEYHISARFCTPKTKGGKADTVLVLTHGLFFDKRYWAPDFAGSEKYNFVQAALASGYSVFYYDRLGNGNSTKPDPYLDTQFSVEVDILAELVQGLRSEKFVQTTFKDVVLVGHSYGSYLSSAVASILPQEVAGIILTGYSGSFEFFNIFIAGVQLRVASTISPSQWSSLPPAYLIAVDLFALNFVNFKTPFFDRAVAEWTGLVTVTQPFGIGELLTLGASLGQYPFADYGGAVMVLQGKEDNSACGGNCDGVLTGLSDTWANARLLNVTGDLAAGHALNLHFVAPEAFGRVFDFLSSAGL